MNIVFTSDQNDRDRNEHKQKGFAAGAITFIRFVFGTCRLSGRSAKPVFDKAGPGLPANLMESPRSASAARDRTKPIDFDEFIAVVKSLEESWLTIVKLPQGAGKQTYA